LKIKRPSIRRFFHLYNLPIDRDRWNFIVKPKLLSANGKSIEIAPASLKKLISPAALNEGSVYINLSLNGAQAGKYQLIIDIFNSDNTQAASMQTDLELLPK
jgi:hypothetical protein